LQPQQSEERHKCDFREKICSQEQIVWAKAGMKKYGGNQKSNISPVAVQTVSNFRQTDFGTGLLMKKVSTLPSRTISRN